MMPARWTWAGVWFTPVVAVTATAAISPEAAAIRTAATHSRTRRVMATSFARCDLRCEIIGGSALRRRRIGVASPGRARARQQAGADLRQGRQRTGTASPALGRNPAAAARWYGPRIMGTGIYLWHGQFLSRDRACRALGELFGCAPSPGALASAAKKTAGLIAPALAAITRYLASAEAAHFDETGFRTAGRLAWVHSASWGKFVLVTVHAKRGKDGMTAAGVPPLFTGIAVHDAWKPYDSFDNVAGHALCGAHVLRELVAVTETGTDLDKAWAQQAIDALLALDKAAEAARQAGKDDVGPEVLAARGLVPQGRG